MILNLRRIAELMNKVCNTDIDINKLPEQYFLTENINTYIINNDNTINGDITNDNRQGN